MPVDIRLMRYVVAIAEEGSFGRAAARLHIAQPPLSRQVGELERELGVRLFERRPTRLTAAGEAFVESARKVIADVDRAVARTKAVAGGAVGVVRVGYVVSAAYEVLPRLQAAARKQAPGIRLDVTETDSAALAQGLRDGRYDLVFSRSITDFHRLSVTREPLVAVISRTHPLAGRESVSVRELRGSRLLLSEHHLPRYREAVLTAVQGILDEVVNTRIAGWRYSDELLDSRTITLVPRTLGDHPPSTAVTVRLEEEPPAADLQAVWTTDLSPPAGRIVELVRTIFD
ncbi:LysR substrate-binding domain-containing protein [Fodinicola feengrottensis]|uniref:LysR substrate-binding domain-containing protein n=1 Tax=Fodinicola feengrottensis TaxID=435914 RepID=A0ABP4RQ08_9ACTN